MLFAVICPCLLCSSVDPFGWQKVRAAGLEHRLGPVNLIATRSLSLFAWICRLGEKEPAIHTMEKPTYLCSPFAPTRLFLFLFLVLTAVPASLSIFPLREGSKKLSPRNQRHRGSRSKRCSRSSCVRPRDQSWRRAMRSLIRFAGVSLRVRNRCSLERGAANVSSGPTVIRA